MIRIKLAKHSVALSEFDNVIDFFMDSTTIVKDSPFARSLLKQRLLIEGHVVVMLDGFDKISQCRKGAIQFMKATLGR